MQFSANISTMYQEFPLIDRFAAARKAGFRGVEIQFPYSHTPQELATARDDAGIKVVLFNVPPGDFEAGERGLAALPGREADFRAAISLACEYVDVLGANGLNVLAGIPGPDADPEACQATFVSNLEYAATELAKLGVKAYVEPLNNRDVVGFFVPTSELVVAAIDAAGHDNLALQYDLYHARMMDTDPVAELERWMPRLEHIQFADAPGRFAPGTGDIDWPAAFETLKRLDYTGWFGAEYISRQSTESTFGWLETYGTKGETHD
jgi:hydroxypyruvate isomerase